MEKYQFIKQIGQGSYGDVWLVKSSKTKKNYVLKRIDFHQFARREQRAAQLEAKLLCTVRHPNIVTYLDSFYNSKGSLFIVMSYCEYGTLHDFIKNRNVIYFEEEEVIKWIVQICMALKYLHDQSIVHRDIKTRNIFLTKQKSVKIGNFGIARTFNIAEDMSSTLISSPIYTSPEVLSGAPFGQKSDVWSLGCCAYEIATLRYAFIAQDISTLMHPFVHFKVSAIAEIHSSKLFDIILSMLNLEPEKRPSVTELLLNDYIRKHILLFLRDSSQRSDSPQSYSYKRSSNVHSEINSPTISIDGVKDKSHRKIREGVFKTIPDINGNGDANDNSQQQASCEDLWNTKRKPTFGLSKSNSILSTSDKSIKTGSSSDIEGENHSYEVNSSLHVKRNHVTNLKQFEKRLSFYTQKLKSENSFQLLNTITNSINISRFKSLDSINDSYLLFKSKYSYDENPPKSAEDLLSISKNANSYLLRRPATSADVNFDVISSDLSKSCLPKIKENLIERNASTVNNGSYINLPPLHNSQHHRSDDAPENDSLPNLEESIVDKFLLRNIMECNKVKQKDSIGFKTSSRHKMHETIVPFTNEALCHENVNS